MVRLLSISNYNMEVEIVQYNQLNVIGIDVEANSKTGECFDEKICLFRGMVIKRRVPTLEMKFSQNFFLKVSRYMIWKRLSRSFAIFEHIDLFRPRIALPY